MYNHAPTDYVCTMCQIAKNEPTENGSQEADVVYRDDFITAFIAGKEWRNNKGHVVIIPNAHTENLYDIPFELGHKVFNFSQKVAVALKETYNCDGISTRQHNEPAGNQDVFHYHLHVFPRYKDDRLYQNHDESFWPTAEEKLPYATRLRTYFEIQNSKGESA